MAPVGQEAPRVQIAQLLDGGAATGPAWISTVTTITVVAAAMSARMVRRVREAHASAQEVLRSVEAPAAQVGCRAVVAPVSMSKLTITIVVAAVMSASRVQPA